jgi:hypothetical protein
VLELVLHPPRRACHLRLLLLSLSLNRISPAGLLLIL